MKSINLKLFTIFFVLLTVGSIKAITFTNKSDKAIEIGFYKKQFWGMTKKTNLIKVEPNEDSDDINLEGVESITISNPQPVPKYEPKL